MVVTFHDATLATKQALPFTRTGLPPAGSRQLPDALTVHLLERSAFFIRSSGSKMRRHRNLDNPSSENLETWWRPVVTIQFPPRETSHAAKCS
jgi:hypothetical protein